MRLHSVPALLPLPCCRVARVLCYYGSERALSPGLGAYSAVLDEERGTSRSRTATCTNHEWTGLRSICPSPSMATRLSFHRSRSSSASQPGDDDVESVRFPENSISKA